MTTLIKGGTIVAADRSYVADVLIEGETIKAIGTGLTGDKTIDAKDCLIMPGGIDPHTHLDMPFMGTSSADNYDTGTQGRALRRHDDGRRFLHPRPRPAADGRHRRLGQARGTRHHRLRLSHVHHLLVGQGARGHGARSSRTA